jgi:hypothetical protein
MPTICFSDSWRMNQVEKATANPDHDFSKFGTGNKETLDIIPKVSLPFALYFLIFFSFSLVQFWVLWLRIRDPGSRILIFVYPGFWISDPGSKNSNKREG